jgi:hypothetical protein
LVSLTILSYYQVPQKRVVSQSDRLFLPSNLLYSWDILPSQILLISGPILAQLFDLQFHWWD